MTEIPPQLRFDKFRFIKIRKAEKGAFETNWQKDSNYAWDSPELMKWLADGGNYGVVAGYFDLVIIDSDCDEIKELCNQLPDTFTIRTPGHGSGEHRYYICPGWTENTKFSRGDDDLGQIQTKSKYVVGPGSLHPNSGTYEILNDLPIVAILPEQLSFAFRDWMKSKISASTLNVHEDLADFPILKLIDANDYTRRGDDYYGSHPVHGSTTGQNFHVNTAKNTWYCFRHDVGGGPFQLLAVLESIMQCNELKERALRGQDFINTIKLAENKYGIKVVKGGRNETEKDVLRALAAKDEDKATELLALLIEDTFKMCTPREDGELEMWVYEDGIYAPNGRSSIQEFCRDVLGEAYDAPLVKRVIDKVAADTFVDKEEFFNENWSTLMPVRNGLLDVERRMLLPFTPNKVFFCKMPVYFMHGKDCPAVRAHLKAVLKDENDVPALQELFGFLLLKDYRHEKAFMFVGNGRNGKSKTLELMKRFLGPENCANIPLQQLGKDVFAIAELISKLANLSPDLSSEALQDLGYFKQLTGRDMISAARKFLSRLNFVNYAKMVFCANELPISYDTSDAFWLRWIIFEFPYKFVPKDEYDAASDEERKNLRIKDPDIVAKLTTDDELSGLLNWALEGLARLLQQGEFSYKPKMKDVKSVWQRKSTSFNAFFDDALGSDPLGQINKEEVRQKYAEYCLKNSAQPSSDKMIKWIMTSRGVWDTRFRDGMTDEYRWCGVRWKEVIQANL